jgi:peptidoglycan hydrolase CwlO-like protein
MLPKNKKWSVGMKSTRITAAMLLFILGNPLGSVTYGYNEYDDSGRIVGLTAGGAAIGGIAGGWRGAAIGAGTGALLGVATSRPRGRPHSRKERKRALRKLKAERRELELTLMNIKEELAAIEGGHVQASRKRIRQLQKKARRLRDQIDEIEDEIEELQSHRSRRH